MVAAPATSKTITGLTGGTADTFTVTAINGKKDTGLESAPFNAVTLDRPEPPRGLDRGQRHCWGRLQATVSGTLPGERWW